MNPRSIKKTLCSFTLLPLFVFLVLDAGAAEQTDCTVRVNSEFNSQMAGMVTAHLEASFSNDLDEPVGIVTLAPLSAKGKKLFTRDYIASGQYWYVNASDRSKLNPIQPGETSSLTLDVGQQAIIEHSVGYYGSKSSDEEKLDMLERFIDRAEDKYDEVELCEIRGVTKASSYQ